jgi:serine/threonine protein kinase
VAYPHRASAQELPQAPIGHHWEDSTHIATNVVTAGVRFGKFQMEGANLLISAYNRQMPLPPGTRLGPYEITSPAGAGGMGEVYRARDSRLDRTVAVKVLPQALGERPEILQRFEREARAVSTLNHPNICTLHDVGSHDGTPYLVMEYVEGETLAERLSRGPLPIGDVYRIAIQIGDALDQAHGKKIVHRDLKPGNIMLAGGKTSTIVKLLDFGLAKLPEAQAAAAAGTLTSLPTVAQSLTAEGTIVGTFQYMAPEQLEGKEADPRSDIFAFGAVLFEMATGRKAFGAASQAGLISSIMKDDPPAVSQLEASVPPAFDRIVRQCVAKDPDNRWQTVRDLVHELRWVSESSSQAAVAPAVIARRRRKFGLASAAAVIFAAAFAALAFVHFRESAPDLPAIGFRVEAPENFEIHSPDQPVLSPDGRSVLFHALNRNTTESLALRALGDPEAKLLPGTNDPNDPIWSPDGTQIVFSIVSAGSGKGTRKLDLTSGTSVQLCDATFFDGSWSREGGILAANLNGIARLSPSGGEPNFIRKPDHARGEQFVLWPSFLPDGRHYLYTIVASRPERGGIYVGELDSAKEVRISGEASNARYDSGFLLYGRGRTLMAQPFDTRALRLTGEPAVIAERLIRDDVAWFDTFSAAGGRIVYNAGAALENDQLVWFDRKGARLGTVGEIGEYTNPALSPDGRTLAVGLAETSSSNRDIWLFDLLRGAKTRLTRDPADDFNPTWSPDGSWIAFSSTRKGQRDLYRKAANGTGEDEVLFESADPKAAEDWSQDGKHLLFNRSNLGVYSLDLTVLATERKPVQLAADPTRLVQGQVSPDGRWLAYTTWESGKPEVFVQSFPPGAGKWPISNAGGAEPQWSSGGKELIYVQNDKTLMSVPIRSVGAVLVAGIPKPLFDVSIPSSYRRNRYLVTRDGQKILVITRGDQHAASPTFWVVNWPSAIKR